MSLNAVEKVISNVDIILQVFNLLDLEDQFRLSRASGLLKEVFETYIWRKRYTTLRVIIRPPYFVISNETDMNRLYLNHNQFKEFQRSYAANVEDLTIKIADVAPIPYDSCGFGCDGGELSIPPCPTLSHDHVDLTLFRRVIKLSCHHMLVELSYMHLIADCCPNLEQLSLIKFDHVFSYDDLVSSLKRMRNLKVLFMKTFLPFPMELKYFEGLLSTKNLEQLQLNHNIDLSQIMVDSQQASALPSKLNDLRLWTSFGTGSYRWLKNFATYLSGFSQLSTLNIKLSSSITDAGLAVIADNCKHLEKLTIKCAKFKSLQTFVVPPKLTDLTLIWCAGLTCDNLRQILSQLKLRKFCSKNTNYVGDYEFRVSPYMVSLCIDDISTHHFKPAFESHANLQELSWYQYDSSYDLDAGKALSSWVNLKTLDIRDCDVAFESIHQLRKLRKVIMPRRPPHLTWPFVVELLKHPYLNELILRYPQIDDVMDRHYYIEEELADEGDWAVVAMNSAVSDAEFKTNLRRLELSLEIFEYDAEFWINLFRQNDKLSEMSLICQMAEGINCTLKYLICDEKLPKFIKTINICGITINCKSFRRNFNDDMEKLQNEIDDTELWNDDETYNIVLQRSL